MTSFCFSLQSLCFLALLVRTEAACGKSLWTTGQLHTSMIKLSSNQQDVDKIQAQQGATGWCGSNMPSTLEIAFPHATAIQSVILGLISNVNSFKPYVLDIICMFEGQSTWSSLGSVNVASANVNTTVGLGGLAVLGLKLLNIAGCVNLNLQGCDDIADLCPNFSCQNGGKCYQTETCFCPVPYVGKDCSIEDGVPRGPCTNRMGLVSGGVFDMSKVSVSSFEKGHGKEKVRLNCCHGEDKGGWCPSSTDPSPYIEVNFDKPISLAGLEIEPPAGQYPTSPMNNYVKKFRLSLKLEGQSQWTDFATNIDAISNDTISKSTISLIPQTTTSGVRVYPLESKGERCLRLELFGCDPTGLCSKDYCKNGGVCNGRDSCSCTKGYIGQICDQPVSSLVQYHLSFNSIVNHTVTTSTSIQMTTHGSVTLTSTHALAISGTNSFVTINPTTTNSCLKDIDTCQAGFTFSISVNFQNLHDNTVLVSSTSNPQDGKGILLVYSGGKLHYTVSTSTQQWTTTVTQNVTLNSWHNLELTWSQTQGIALYDNHHLLASSIKPVSKPTTTTQQTTSISIGNSVTHTVNTAVNMQVQSINIFDAHKAILSHQGIVSVTNVTQGTAPPVITKGTTVQPTTITTTTTTSGVTTERPIQSMNLTFLSIKNNVLITQMHNFTTYGHPSLELQPGGSVVLHLNESGQYVELPNKGVQCIQDLTTCNKGFTLNVEIKFLLADHTTDKQYIFSSGGDMVNSSGIALYLWHGELYCSVKWDRQIWTSKDKLPVDPTQWHTYQVSWNKQHGFDVLIDGNFFLNHSVNILNPAQPLIHSLLIGKGFQSNVTTLMDIKNLFVWTASRDVLINLELITVPTTAIPTTTTPTTITTTTTPTTTTSEATTVSTTSNSYVWNFSNISTSSSSSTTTTSTVVTSHNIQANFVGNITVDNSLHAVHIQDHQHIDFGIHPDNCLGNLSLCHNGITLQVNLSFHHLEENTVILTTGGDNPDGTGIACVYRFGSIQCVVSQTNVSWFGSIPYTSILFNVTNSIVISWKHDKGIVLYCNGVLVSQSQVQVPHHTITTSTQHLYIGRPPSMTWTSVTSHTSFYLHTFSCWQNWVDIIINIGGICCQKPTAPATKPTQAPATKPTQAPTTTTTKATTTKPTTARPTTAAPTTPKVTTTPKAPTTAAPVVPTCPTQPVLTTSSCTSGWVCKDTLTTPRTTAGTTKAKTTRAKTTQGTTTPVPTKPGLPSFTTKPHIRPDVDNQGLAYLECTFTKAPQPNVEYIVCLNVDSNCEVMEILGPNQNSFKFSVAQINENLYNKHITCSVKARFKGQTGLTPEFISNTFVPYFKIISSSHMTFVEGQIPVQNIVVNSTAPPQFFCCRGCQGNCQVTITTHVNPDHHYTHCGSNHIPQVVVGWAGTSQSPQPETCGTSVVTSNWQQSIQVPLKATVDNLIDRDHSGSVSVQATIQNKPKLPGLSVTTSSINIGTVQTQAVDKDHNTVCGSVNDPHMTTFDGKRYNNMNTGEFVLYKHTKLPFEVHALYAPCHNSHRGTTCNCAVAIKSGDDVITLSSCGQSHGGGQSQGHGHGLFSLFQHHSHHSSRPGPLQIKMYKNGDLTPGTVIKRLGCGQKYEIHLPTGTTVVVQTSVAEFLNIWVKPSSMDLHNTEGLCGLYDHNSNNDLVDAQNRPVRNTNIFSMRYHCTDQQSIFTGVPADKVPGITEFCSCIQGRSTFCLKGYGVMRCLNGKDDVTDSVVKAAVRPILNSGRHKRQADNNVAQNTEIPTEAPALMPLDEAKDYCRGYIENSAAVQHCNVVVNETEIEARIDNCATDLQLTNDTQWALGHVTDIIEECLNTVQKTANSSSNEEPIVNVTALCTEDCGEHGKCVDGVCQCENGYSGTNCSMSKTNTRPLLLEIPPDGQGCDLRQTDEGCHTADVLGLDFIDSPSLTCHYQYIQVTDTSTTTYGMERKVAAAFISMNQVSCNLTNARDGAMIWVSNDGQSKSDQAFLFMVYDSVCHDCVINSNVSTSHCIRLTDTCIINGACYALNSENPENRFEICNPSLSESKWTNNCDNDPDCHPEVQSQKQEVESDNNMKVVILSVVCGVIGLAFIISLVYICSKRSKTEIKTDQYNLRQKTNRDASPMYLPEKTQQMFENESFNF